MLPRPDFLKRASDHDLPLELDLLLEALGAEIVDYPLRTECCGGHLPQIGPEMAFEMIRRLISTADGLHAAAMVTICPMCQLNLDGFQGEMNHFFGTQYRMPVLFFTQLIGLALGMEPKELGIGLELVSARIVLDQLGVEPPPATPSGPSKRLRRTEGLPMPKPLAKHTKTDAPEAMMQESR